MNYINERRFTPCSQALLPFYKPGLRFTNAVLRLGDPPIVKIRNGRRSVDTRASTSERRQPGSHVESVIGTWLPLHSIQWLTLDAMLCYVMLFHESTRLTFPLFAKP